MFLSGAWGAWVGVCVLAFPVLVWFYDGGSSASSLTCWSGCIRSLILDRVACISGSGCLTFSLSPTWLYLEGFLFISSQTFLHCLRNIRVSQTVTPTTPLLCRLSVFGLLIHPFQTSGSSRYLPVILKAKSPERPSLKFWETERGWAFCIPVFTWCGIT